MKVKIKGLRTAQISKTCTNKIIMVWSTEQTHSISKINHVSCINRLGHKINICTLQTLKTGFPDDVQGSDTLFKSRLNAFL